MSNGPFVVTEEQFTDVLEKKLGAYWERALAVFRNYGDSLTWDVTNVLMHAGDQDKVDEVLNILEEHYKKHLQFQHPEIRGRVEKLGMNPTEAMFLGICQKTLGLKPNPK